MAGARTALQRAGSLLLLACGCLGDAVPAAGAGGAAAAGVGTGGASTIRTLPAAVPAAVPAHAAVGITPPMGWNPYNHYGCGGTEAELREQTAALLRLGLHKAGFNYVNLDCGWAARNRSASGHIVPDPRKFPNGLKPLADWVHAQGLLFGICEFLPPRCLSAFVRAAAAHPTAGC